MWFLVFLIRLFQECLVGFWFVQSRDLWFMVFQWLVWQRLVFIVGFWSSSFSSCWEFLERRVVGFVSFYGIQFFAVGFTDLCFKEFFRGFWCSLSLGIWEFVLFWWVFSFIFSFVELILFGVMSCIVVVVVFWGFAIQYYS